MKVGDKMLNLLKNILLSRSVSGVVAKAELWAPSGSIS